MRTRFVGAVVLVAALVAACGDDEDDDLIADDTDVTTTTAAAAAEAVLQLAPDGLLVDGEPLAFGADAVDVVEQLTAVLGEPSDTGSDEECPLGPVDYARFGTAPGGILLTMQDGELVGWSLGQDDGLRFASGIGLGSTLAEVEAELGPVEMIPESTLGIEFFVGDAPVSGLLAADGPGGTVTDLWAGANCIYR